MSENTLPKKVQRRFEYGIEYLVYTPGRGEEAQNILIQNNISTCRIHTDFVGLVDQFYMINPLRHSPYKFFESIVQEVDAEKEEEWRKYTVLRGLDECEVIDVLNALKGEPLFGLDHRIVKAETLLREHGIPIAKHGWYKVRMLY